MPRLSTNKHLHFLDSSESDMCSVTLGVYELEERHTSEYIAEKFNKVCQEWGIKDEQVSCIVTDGAANMTKAVDICFGKLKHIICFAHKLNLVVTKALERVEEFCVILRKVKNIVRWFKQSVAASDALKKAQTIEENQLTLKQDVPTRWNSTYYMFEWFLKLRTPICAIINNEISAPPMLTAKEMREVEVAISLLQPFESATREISASKYSTGSIIIPLVHILRQCLEKVQMKEALPLGRALKLSLSTEIDKRLATAEQMEMLAVATILDPRFKKIYFSNALHCAKAVEFIHNYITQNSLNYLDTEQSMETNEVRPQESDTGSTNFNLWANHNRLVIEKTTEALEGSSERRQSEIARYLRAPLEPLQINPLEWWQRHKLIYVGLSPLAAKMLSIVATSVPAERLFSKAGETITQKRNSLQGKRLFQLLFLQSVDKKFWDL